MNVRGKLMSFQRPLVMGILNLTPDSFYAGSRIQDQQELLTQASIMMTEGADILDLGGYSSRPGATDISEQEELDRVSGAVEMVLKEIPDVILSVDTFRSAVAREVLQLGAHIINDIAGGQLDDQMFNTVAEFQAPYILMHMKGTPQTMKDQTDYNHILLDLQSYFSERVEQAKNAGIKDIIIDPGFGFSKTIQQNYKVLQNLEMFHIHDCPILVGISRKSMIYKTLGTSADEALNGTTALNTFALNKGTSILRVHDVKEAKELVDLTMAIRQA